MEQKLQRGQQVRVKAYGGRQPYVTVVEDRGDVVLICKTQEFELAMAEKREPASVGFHKEDVIVSRGVSSERYQEDFKSRAGD